MTLLRYPSFKALHGREPLPGVDYDPERELCQDDYEYLSGTGRYTDDPMYTPIQIAAETKHEKMKAWQAAEKTYRENRTEDNLRDLIRLGSVYFAAVCEFDRITRLWYAGDPVDVK